jgi:hypothetical protein
MRLYKQYLVENLCSFATLCYAAASTTGATNRRAIRANGEIHGPKVTTALFAVRFAAIGTRSAVRTHRICIVISGVDRTRRNVLINDRFHKGAGAHGTHFEETNLFASQTHLRDGIVDHHAELGMETNLKRIATHNHTDVTPTRTRR